MFGRSGAVGMSMDQMMSGLRTRSGGAAASETAGLSVQAPSAQKTANTQEQDAGDTAEISQAAREQYATAQALAPTRTDAPGATMSATTKSGNTITLEARNVGHKRFAMGNTPDHMILAGSDKSQKTAFNLVAWDAGSEKLTPLEFVATVKDTLGREQQYLLTGNTLFTEDEHGVLRLSDKGQTEGTLVGTDGNDVMLNITDDSIVDAGKGDDIILNMGLRAALKGGDGDDIITSMGDGAVIAGNDGNDSIAVLYETLRNGLQKEQSMKDRELVNQGTIRDAAAQTVSIDAGDGDDSILVRPDLYKANIKGGNGDDTLTFNSVAASTVETGDGNDSVDGENFVKTTLQMGDGDDTTFLRQATANTRINLGDGDDMANIGVMENASLYGGGGKDTARIGYARHSTFEKVESLYMKVYYDVVVDGAHFEGGEKGEWRDGKLILGGADSVEQDANRGEALQQNSRRLGSV